MTEQEVKETTFYCCVCHNDGYYFDDFGSCGSPIKKKCYNCDNDFEEDEDD